MIIIVIIIVIFLLLIISIIRFFELLAGELKEARARALGDFEDSFFRLSTFYLSTFFSPFYFLSTFTFLLSTSHSDILRTISGLRTRVFLSLRIGGPLNSIFRSSILGIPQVLKFTTGSDRWPIDARGFRYIYIYIHIYRERERERER